MDKRSTRKRCSGVRRSGWKIGKIACAGGIRSATGLREIGFVDVDVFFKVICRQLWRAATGEKDAHLELVAIDDDRAERIMLTGGSGSSGAAELVLLLPGIIAPALAGGAGDHRSAQRRGGVGAGQPEVVVDAAAQYRRAGAEPGARPPLGGERGLGAPCDAGGRRRAAFFCFISIVTCSMVWRLITERSTRSARCATIMRSTKLVEKPSPACARLAIIRPFSRATGRIRRHSRRPHQPGYLDRLRRRSRWRSSTVARFPYPVLHIAGERTTASRTGATAQTRCTARQQAPGHRGFA